MNKSEKSKVLLLRRERADFVDFLRCKGCLYRFNHLSPCVLVWNPQKLDSRGT